MIRREATLASPTNPGPMDHSGHQIRSKVGQKYCGKDQPRAPENGAPQPSYKSEHQQEKRKDRDNLDAAEPARKTAVTGVRSGLLDHVRRLPIEFYKRGSEKQSQFQWVPGLNESARGAVNPLREIGRAHV